MIRLLLVLPLALAPAGVAPAHAPDAVRATESATDDGPPEVEELERPVDLEAFRLRIADERRAPVALYVTMATWCPSCAREKPQTLLLRERFAQDELAFFGVPIDPTEDASILEDYVAKKAPGYEVLAERAPERVMELRRVLFQAFHADMLPGSVAVDAEGRVIATYSGLPTYSQLRKLVAQETSR